MEEYANQSREEGSGRFETSKVNRVEVIDEKGRSYVNWKPTNKTDVVLQDGGRTLKIFINH